MESLLYLCHRIPFPPNKGEKITAFNVLKYLMTRFRVHLGCFVDEPDDWAHVEPLRAHCTTLTCFARGPMASRIGMLRGLLTGAPLTVTSFANAQMDAWVADFLQREKPAAIFLYCSAMAQYVIGRDLGSARLVMDFADVDSDKWLQYSRTAAFPLSWIYAREARLLLAYDRKVAARADASFLVTDAETALFQQLAPESAAKIHTVANGIDCTYFSPGHVFPSPFTSSPAFVFTGTMDYHPNVDAVIWFAKEIFPRLQAKLPGAVFAIVGAKPSRGVAALAGPSIIVTGRVADVRPYLAHADVVVAPMRIARGIQNKVLEGMAMAKPVVTTPRGLEGIDALPDRHLLVADTAEGFADTVLRALTPEAQALGPAARQLMETTYSWPGRLAPLDKLL